MWGNGRRFFAGAATAVLVVLPVHSFAAERAVQRDVARIVHVLPPPSEPAPSARKNRHENSTSTHDDAVRVGTQQLNEKRSVSIRDALKERAARKSSERTSRDAEAAATRADNNTEAAASRNGSTAAAPVMREPHSGKSAGAAAHHEPAVGHARLHSPPTIWFSSDDERSATDAVTVHRSTPSLPAAPARQITTPAARQRAATGKPAAPAAEQTTVSLAPPPVIRSKSTASESPGVLSRFFGALTRRRDTGKSNSANTIVPLSEPSSEEALLLELVNVERTSRGIAPVVWDGMLAQVARLHAVDMSSVRKMSHHSSQDGADFATRLARTSYAAKGAAENIAYNSNVMSAHRALMNSPGHRRNILDPALLAIGPGVMSEPNGEWVYVTEDFATPVARISDEQAAAKIAKLLAGERSRSRNTPLVEDPAISKRLSRSLEKMVTSGAVRGTATGSVGWTLAFTSMDLSLPPPGALEHVSDASSYGLAVTFRKTKQYPFGTYWAILFLAGEEASRTTASAPAATTAR